MASKKTSTTTAVVKPSGIAFKRIALESRFTHEGTKFRKCGDNEAFELTAEGRGKTHARVHFANSTFVNPLSA